MSLTAEAEQTRAPGDAGDRENYEAYRTMSAAAVASCVLGAVSIVALLNFWPPKALAVVGLLTGLVALRQIKRHPDEYAGLKAARVGVGLSAFFLTVGTAVSLLVPIFEVPEGAERISYEQLKPTADRPNVVPESAVALDGQKVFIKGYMFPTDHAQGIRKFLLCRDNGDCCFGGQPPTSDMIWVELAEPLETDHTSAIRGVAGTFRVAGSRMESVNQQILYRLEADYIK